LVFRLLTRRVGPGRIHATAASGLTVALLCLAGCGGQATLDSKAVRNEAETIASLGTEGNIVAEQLARERLKESFAQVHAADLAELAAKSEEGLEPSLATAKLKRTVERLRTLAEDVSVQLRAVETDPREEQILGSAGERLDQLAAAAERIAGGL
jgi:hypothetical protein